MQIDTSAITGIDVAVTECKNGTCLGQVQMNVILVFTTKLAISQLREIFAPRLIACWHRVMACFKVKKLTDAALNTAQGALQLALPEDVEEALSMDADSKQRLSLIHI